MRLLIATLMTASLLAAQEPGEFRPPPDYEAVVISVKTLTGDAFNRMVSMLDVFGARVRADAQLRTIVVYASPRVTQQIQKMVADLDRPGSPAAIGRNIDMTVSLIECLKAAPADPRAIPAELDSVARQLRTTMQCADPQLLESMPLRVQEGRDAEQWITLGPSSTRASSLRVRLHADSVGTKENSRYLRIRDFQVSLTLRPGEGRAEISSNINTAGDFSEAQKTVVGRLSGAEGPVYAVIAIKILD